MNRHLFLVANIVSNSFLLLLVRHLLLVAMHLFLVANRNLKSNSAARTRVTHATADSTQNSKSPARSLVVTYFECRTCDICFEKAGACSSSSQPVAAHFLDFLSPSVVQLDRWLFVQPRKQKKTAEKNHGRPFFPTLAPRRPT